MNCPLHSLEVKGARPPKSGQSPVSHNQDPDPRFTSLAPFNVSLEANDSINSHAWSNLTVQFGPSPGCGLPHFPIYESPVFVLGAVIIALSAVVLVAFVRRARRRRRAKRVGERGASEGAAPEKPEPTPNGAPLDAIAHDR